MDSAFGVRLPSTVRLSGPARVSWIERRFSSGIGLHLPMREESLAHHIAFHVPALRTRVWTPGRWLSAAVIHFDDDQRTHLRNHLSSNVVVMAMPVRVMIYLATVLSALAIAVTYAQSPQNLSATIVTNQYDLKTKGLDLLVAEAERASFFALGELHGENEIPELIRRLWPSLWKAGYRHVAAELSPWAARRLEFERSKLLPEGGHGLWRTAEAETVTAFKKGSQPVLWGCDIEEVRPAQLIRELASRNANNRTLQIMAEKTADGYQRREAAELFTMARRALEDSQTPRDQGRSLRDLVHTLEVESLRSSPATRFAASTRRELVMKELFLENYRSMGNSVKVFARFGRNHLHRGYDRRGVSTLGNFIAEFATAQGKLSFHVAAFGAGGRVQLQGGVVDWDETTDDPAFALLASQARYAATVFDLRPIRASLHQIPDAKRSPAEASLIYWADSYDAIICYRQVTPLP